MLNGGGLKLLGGPDQLLGGISPKGGARFRFNRLGGWPLFAPICPLGPNMGGGAQLSPPGGPAFDDGIDGGPGGPGGPGAQPCMSPLLLGGNRKLSLFSSLGSTFNAIRGGINVGDV